MNIKAIIGLGNPGAKYYHTRHNIGFRIVDALATRYGGVWEKKGAMEVASMVMQDNKILLIKPQTFMNSSGEVIPFLTKQGIKVENIIVVHDELELPFGTIKEKFDGSARGHNGLKSIIQHVGANFRRLRFGIGRPENCEAVPDYVLEKFSVHEEGMMPDEIEKAVSMLEEAVKKRGAEAPLK